MAAAGSKASHSAQGTGNTDHNPGKVRLGEGELPQDENEAPQVIDRRKGHQD